MKVENRSSACSSDNHYILSTSVTSDSSDEDMPEFFQIFRDFFALVPKNRSFEVACKVYLRENDKPDHFPSSQGHVPMKNMPKNKYVASKNKLENHSKDRPVCIAKYGNDLNFGNLLPDGEKNCDYSLLRQVSSNSLGKSTSNSDLKVKKSKIRPLGEHDYTRSPYLDSPEESVAEKYANDLANSQANKRREDETYTLEELRQIIQGSSAPIARKARSMMTLLEANQRLAMNVDNLEKPHSSSTVSTQYENLYMSSPSTDQTSVLSDQTDLTSLTANSNCMKSEAPASAKSDMSSSTITPAKSSMSTDSSSSNSSSCKKPKAKRATPVTTSCSECSSADSSALSVRPINMSSKSASSGISNMESPSPNNTATLNSSTSYLFDQKLEGWSYISSKPSKDPNSTDVYVRISDIF